MQKPSRTFIRSRILGYCVRFLQQSQAFDEFHQNVTSALMKLPCFALTTTLDTLPLSNSLLRHAIVGVFADSPAAKLRVQWPRGFTFFITFSNLTIRPLLQRYWKLVDVENDGDIPKKILLEMSRTIVGEMCHIADLLASPESIGRFEPFHSSEIEFLTENIVDCVTAFTSLPEISCSKRSFKVGDSGASSHM